MKNNKVLSLVSATFIIQLSVVLTGLYLLRDVKSLKPIQAAVVNQKLLNQTLPLAEKSTEKTILESPKASKLKPVVNKTETTNTDANNLKVSKAPEQVKTTKESTITDNLPTKKSKSHSNLVEYTIQSGDTLSSIWIKNGGNYAGAIEAAKAFESAGVSLNSLRPGETVRITLKENGGIQKFVKRLPGAKSLVITSNDDGTYSSNLNEPQVIVSKKKVSGIILNSFAESAYRVSVPPELIDDFVDLFGGRVEFSRNVQPGDVFTVVYSEKKTAKGVKLSAGPILAASLENSGKMLAAVQHVDSKGESRFYDESGEPLGNYFLRYPLRFTRISSQFSNSRFHPVLKISRPHNGVDFAAPIGTPVRAVADGIIQSAGWSGGSGKMVKIKHCDRWSTAYLHLNSISKTLRPGTKVKRGEVIGTVGKTGLATGPHLHFSMYDRGRYVDPMNTELPKMPTENMIPTEFLRATLRMLEQEKETIQIAAANTSTSLG
ncbi:MAG: peptidoglycan DD-metalloendopeptidase family protein [Bdellovibrionales bacterium]|nr:peptidoglycan DD-metalloendopeptidase family protein [Bdellovibrionales bacterium]